MLERSDIDKPLWRKKVDGTLLKGSSTPIPQWLWDIWSIEQTFGKVTSKKDPKSAVKLIYNGRNFKGNVTRIKNPNGHRYRLQFEKPLANALSDVYLMSYMRLLESELSSNQSHREIEKEISFWEFLDIEFDYSHKLFRLTSHYTIKPQFPNLFAKLINSAPLKAIGAEVLEKDAKKIHKQDWKEKSEYKTELGAENVIYMLADSVSKLIYVGEANVLVKRFDNGHPDIKNWNYYKYNVLPTELAEYRLAIERMVIRDLAALLENKQDIPNIKISEYKLANRKIDK
jgi:hypothetical protein